MVVAMYEVTFKPSSFSVGQHRDYVHDQCQPVLKSEPSHEIPDQMDFFRKWLDFTGKI